jgi:hypothetical protein
MRMKLAISSTSGSPLRRPLKALRYCAGLLTLLLAACGGGGGGGAVAVQGCTGANCGTLQIGLTDADGDFIRYAVDVVSIDLTNANGEVVHTLPAGPSTRVDFAQYVDVTEFLTAASIPAGAYKKASVTLDYTNADIQVEVAGAAVPVPAANIRDTDGSALTQLTLEVRFDDGHPLVVAPGAAHLFTIDFNLAASNQVDTVVSPPVLTVSPFLSADVDPVAPKGMRARGPLASTDLVALTYTIDVKPCDHEDDDGDFGQATIQIDANTAFEINGIAFTGVDGLTALAALPAGTPTVAKGNLNVADHTFNAYMVQAGDSVSGNHRDGLIGSVVARSGNTLTVRGATIDRPDGSVVFDDDVTVTIGPDTVVRQEEDGDLHEDGHSQAQGEGHGNGGNDSQPTLDISAISVGQRIQVRGDLTQDPDTQARTIDATAGEVRLLVTHITGTVNSTSAGHIEITLQSIDHRDAAIFDFTGTGTSAETDANPAAYQIDATGISLDLAPGSTVRLFGTVVPFGQATATSDFVGQTVFDLEEGGHANLVIGWGLTGTVAPFTSVTSTALAVDLANPDLGAGLSPHFLLTGETLLDVRTLTGPLTVGPRADGDQHFAIKQGDTIQSFDTFADFSTALNALVDGTNVVSGLYAEGRYDSPTGNFAGKLVVVRIGPATMM